MTPDICECGHVKGSHGYTGYSDGSNDIGKGECRSCKVDGEQSSCKKFTPKTAKQLNDEGKARSPQNQDPVVQGMINASIIKEAKASIELDKGTHTFDESDFSNSNPLVKVHYFNLMGNQYVSEVYSNYSIKIKQIVNGIVEYIKYGSDLEIELK